MAPRSLLCALHAGYGPGKRSPKSIPKAWLAAQKLLSEGGKAGTSFYCEPRELRERLPAHEKAGRAKVAFCQRAQRVGRENFFTADFADLKSQPAERAVNGDRMENTTELGTVEGRVPIPDSAE
jgi:hypothetical protein